MDPNPSDSNAMAMVVDTNSEAWSTASSTIIDTQSEPPRCQGREADKIRMRATSAHQPTLPPLTSKSPRTAQPRPPSSSSASVSSSAGGSLAAKLESNKQCRNSASSKASKSTSKSSRVAGHKSSKAGSKVSSVAATGSGSASGVRSKKPNQSSARSTTSSITASVATKEVIASKKKKSSGSASKTSSSGSRQRSAGSNSGSHGHTSHISGASKTTKAKTEPSSQSNTNTRRNSRDPEESTARSTHPDSSPHGHNQSYNSNSHTSNNNPPPFSHALVPVPPPSRPAPSNHRLLDPPSAGECTSSTASSTAELIESSDPPSMVDSFGYAKTYAPKQQDDETRNSHASSRNRGSVEESMLTDDGLESRMMDTTLPTYSGEGESSRATSVSTSPSSEGCSRISEEEEEEEESYYSDEENSKGGSESGSEVERALAIREENDSEATSTRGDDGEDENAEFKDSHALVQNDYYDGAVNSSYDEVREGDVAIVPETNDASRYLSKAVDNHQAIVPIDSSVYEAYDHTFVTCPEHLRFRFLYTFLKKNLDKKVMIFFSTSNSAKFHAKLLGHFHVPTLTMHGKQSREKFISRFFKFSDGDTGILCATDAAGRDLDIPPSVDWVVQFEPPDDPSEYILRVARISCDSDRVGRSLLFLNPGEQGFLKYYHSASIPVSEFEIPKNKLADVQSHIEYHVNENERLTALSRDAYGSYLISYASHGFRDVYNVHDLNKNDVANAFGLVGLPSEVDDMTLDTTTLAVSTYGDAGEGLPTRSGGGGGGGSNSKGRKTWQKEEKQQTKSWMRGEKSWPHSQIKMHPKFKQQHGEDV